MDGTRSFKIDHQFLMLLVRCIHPSVAQKNAASNNDRSQTEPFHKHKSTIVGHVHVRAMMYWKGVKT